MSFAIVAELPLGTYRGHVGDQIVDRVPSPARLAAALLCAAAAGTRGQAAGGTLSPCAADLASLRWLEEHPPDGMRVPGMHVNRVAGIAYRNSLLSKGASVKAAKPMASVAWDGAVAWTWRQSPPEAVRSSLEALCPDVSHLGMAETPVVLRVGETEPTHDLDLDAQWWASAAGDVDVTIPVAGRTRALLETHRAHTTAPVRARDEAVRSDEVHHRPPLVAAGLADARYVARRRPQPATPWVHVLVAGVDRLPPAGWRVRWADAVRRALISLIGDGAPAAITGRYAAGAARPANRCALHFLSPEWSRMAGLSGGRATLALMIPEGIEGADLAVIARGWRDLSRVRGPGGRSMFLRERAGRRADEFWPIVPSGFQRLWRTEPAAVPETRGQRGGWSLADAVALSIGLVFRDQLAGPGRGQAWYRALVQAASAAGVRVASAARVRDGDLTRFVHKTQQQLVVQPYRAVVDLGGLAADRTLLAVGQSRHLGCGLLVPVDVPAGAADGAGR